MKALSMASAILILGGCAATPRGKPVLTEKAMKEALAACHASGGRFIRSKRGLPSFSVRSRASEFGGATPTPTQSCVHQRLQAYGYDMMQLDDPEDYAS